MIGAYVMDMWQEIIVVAVIFSYVVAILRFQRAYIQFHGSYRYYVFIAASLRFHYGYTKAYQLYNFQFVLGRVGLRQVQ